MEPSWIETACKIALYSYFLVVAFAMLWIATRPVLGRGLARWVVEYIGNLDMAPHPHTTNGTDRRRDRSARVLMDHIRKDMIRREVHPAETEQIMEELRERIRAEGPGPTR